MLFSNSKPRFNVLSSVSSNSYNEYTKKISFHNKLYQKNSCHQKKIEELCGEVHKTEGMADVKSKRCEEEGCASHPVFNVDGAATGRFCKVHKTEGMVDVKSKRCEEEGCASRPS